MRVLVLYASDRVSGPGRGLIQLASTLRGRAELTICNFGRPTRLMNEFSVAVRDAGLDYRVISQSHAFDPGIVPQAFDLLGERPYDVVQSHGYKTHLLGLILSRRAGVPWVAVAHGWTDEDLRVRMYNRLERWLLRLPPTAIAVSPLLGRTVAALRQGKRTSTILNAIEVDRFPQEDPEEARREVCARHQIDESSRLVVVAGRLSPEKGQDQLIDAMAVMNTVAQRRPAVFLLVGEGSTEPRLREMARASGVADRLRFTGFVSDVHRYLLAADLVALPSRSEGLPNVVLEAHLLRRPVVAFDVGGVAEVIDDGETGWLVSAGDTAAFASALSAALADSEERTIRGDRAHDSLFPKFSVEGRAQAFLSEYQRLARRPVLRSVS